MKVLINISLIFLLLLYFSCTNEDFERSINEQLSFDEQELLTKMKDASMVIAQFADRKDVQDELDQMIKMKMYNDDYVFFRDLFSPNVNEKLKSANIEQTAFKKAFDQAISNNGLKSEKIDDLENYLVSNNLVLYIPYPVEMYPDNKRIPTVAYHPLLNDSLGEGFQFLSSAKPNSDLNFKRVQVNDAYALKNLCFLIVPAEKLGFESDNLQFKSVSSPTAGQHYEIRVGKAACFKQYDDIFSGGSEIFFANVTGDLNLTNGQVTAVPKGFTKSITRFEILMRFPVDVNTLFLADWKTDLTQVSVFVFEDDPVGSREVSGSVKTTASAKITPTSGGTSSSGTTPDVTTTTNGTTYKGEVNGAFEYQASWKATVVSSDAIIMHTDYPRDWFFETNSDPTAEFGLWSDAYGAIYRGVYNQFVFCLYVIERSY